jgi:predicted dehydrogenase
MSASRTYGDPARIGVIGAGRIGRRHIQLVRASPECVLAGIADPVGGPTAASLGDGVPWYEGPEGLLSHAGLDGVIVATPSAMHLEHGMACIQAGIPSLIEKPIATTVDDGLALAAAAEQRGVPLLVGHHRRHSSTMAAARAALQDGMIGDVVAVSGAALFAKPEGYFEAAPWRAQPGGGPILINLVHEIDDLRALCGDVVRVHAISSTAVRRHAVEDTAALVLQFASGALGTFLVSDAAASPWSWEQTSGEDAAYARYETEDCYLIAGTKGSLAVPTLRVWTSAGEASWHAPMQLTTLETAPADPLERQLAHFCAVIRGEAEPLAPARDAIETLRVTLAVQEAAKSGAAMSTTLPGPF